MHSSSMTKRTHPYDRRKNEDERRGKREEEVKKESRVK